MTLRHIPSSQNCLWMNYFLFAIHLFCTWSQTPINLHGLATSKKNSGQSRDLNNFSPLCLSLTLLLSYFRLLSVALTDTSRAPEHSFTNIITPDSQKDRQKARSQLAITRLIISNPEAVRGHKLGKNLQVPPFPPKRLKGLSAEFRWGNSWVALY